MITDRHDTFSHFVCVYVAQEFTQRLLMRVRVEFQDCFKFTIAMDKSKVGKELVSLVYLYCGEKHLGTMLPPQVAHDLRRGSASACQQVFCFDSWATHYAWCKCDCMLAFIPHIGCGCLL